MTIPITHSEARLLELQAETQELLPEHTYKAFMRRVNSRPKNERREMLELGLAEFKRGLPG